MIPPACMNYSFDSQVTIELSLGLIIQTKQAGITNSARFGSFVYGACGGLFVVKVESVPYLDEAAKVR